MITPSNQRISDTLFDTLNFTVSVNYYFTIRNYTNTSRIYLVASGYEQRERISLNLSIPLKTWDKKKQRVKELNQNLIHTNLVIGQMETKIEKIKLNYLANDMILTPELLVKELKAMGMTDVTIDKNGYVMATLESNVKHEVPTIGFVSHYDTTPDFTGANVKPQIVKNYDGGDIVLNKKQNIVLSPSYFKDLLQYKGQTLITTDGTTLLGADDKAGITEIMSAMEYLIQHPEIKHGKIRVGFTPDEEIGRGAHKFDVEKFGCDWAYTMDGSQIGELEYENFNAAGVKITFKGKSVHPGYAKGKMINSMLIANDFINQLPVAEED